MDFLFHIFKGILLPQHSGIKLLVIDITENLNVFSIFQLFLSDIII